MNFDATYSGRVYALQDGAVYTIRPDGAFAYAGALTGANKRVALTGYTAVSPKGNLHYQTTGGGWIYLPDGWQEVGTVSVMQYSQSQAQALVNKIIKNNIRIVQNNLVCARYANKFSSEQQQLIRDLQNRAEARKGQLQAGGLCSGITTSYPKGYADLGAYLDALMAGEPIGIASWAIVVIAAVVVAATATAAYYTYRYFADESEQDIKYSKELMAVLQAKLTPEEYQQLLDETKGIVTKAKIRQAVSSYGNVLKYAAFAVAGYSIYKFIKSRQQ